jgi:hypothetical protein
LKNLGKIIFFICIFSLSLFAKVKLDAPQQYFQGDGIEFRISASGKDIQLPDIKKIGDYQVRTFGTSTQTNVFNGVQTTSLVKNYMVYPQGDLHIPSFEVKINGKSVKTKPHIVRMVKVEKTKSDLYSFDLTVDKNEVYVGEGIKLQIEFKYRKDLNIVSLEFEKPEFDGFWVKKLKSDVKKNDPIYNYQSLHYLLFPQKPGKQEIGVMKINVLTLDNKYANSFFFTGATNSTPVYSNVINLNIKPLPQGIDLIGKFAMEGSVDKKIVQAGEPVSYRLKIKGEGNIDDIKELKLEIPGVTIYENPAKKKYSIQKGNYGGVYDKVFSIVAAEDFVIPSVTLQYFDKGLNQVKALRTQEYAVQVIGEKKKEKAVLKVAQEEDKTAVIVPNNGVTKKKGSIDIWHGVFFLLGVLVTLLLLVVYNLLKLNRKQIEKETPLSVKVKNAKSADELFKILVNYINIDKDLDKIIYQLEDGIAVEQLKKVKKEVISIVKDI